MFEFVEDSVKLFADAFAFGDFDSFGFFHDYVGVHHDEAAVCVVDKAFVIGLFHKAWDGF